MFSFFNNCVTQYGAVKIFKFSNLQIRNLPIFKSDCVAARIPSHFRLFKEKSLNAIHFF